MRNKFRLISVIATIISLLATLISELADGKLMETEIDEKINEAFSKREGIFA